MKVRVTEVSDPSPGQHRGPQSLLRLFSSSHFPPLPPTSLTAHVNPSFVRVRPSPAEIESYNKQRC